MAFTLPIVKTDGSVDWDSAETFVQPDDYVWLYGPILGSTPSETVEMLIAANLEHPKVNGLIVRPADLTPVFKSANERIDAWLSAAVNATSLSYNDLAYFTSTALPWSKMAHVYPLDSDFYKKAIGICWGSLWTVFSYFPEAIRLTVIPSDQIWKSKPVGDLPPEEWLVRMKDGMKVEEARSIPIDRWDKEFPEPEPPAPELPAPEETTPKETNPTNPTNETKEPIHDIPRGC